MAGNDGTGTRIHTGQCRNGSAGGSRTVPMGGAIFRTQRSNVPGQRRKSSVPDSAANVGPGQPERQRLITGQRRRRNPPEGGDSQDSLTARWARKAAVSPGRRGAQQAGRCATEKWPRPAVTAVAAVCGAAIAAAITIGTTSHRSTPVTEPAAPAFTLPSLRDPAQMVSLSAYRGHPVIVNFFASWCGPCERETPILAGFYRASAGRAVIIGVDADDNATAARHFIARDGVAYPVGFETTPAVTNVVRGQRGRHPGDLLPELAASHRQADPRRCDHAGTEPGKHRAGRAAGEPGRDRRLPESRLSGAVTSAHESAVRTDPAGRLADAALAAAALRRDRGAGGDRRGRRSRPPAIHRSSGQLICADS